MQSTIACALEQHLLHLHKFTYRLDGDNIRFGLNKDLGFDEKSRNENIRRIGEVRSVPTPNLLRLASRQTCCSCAVPYPPFPRAFSRMLCIHSSRPPVHPRSLRMLCAASPMPHPSHPVE